MSSSTLKLLNKKLKVPHVSGSVEDGVSTSMTFLWLVATKTPVQNTCDSYQRPLKRWRKEGKLARDLREDQW